MRHETFQNDFAEQRIRQQLAEAVEKAVSLTLDLLANREQVVAAPEPYMVGARRLMELLDMKERNFYRLVANEEKGFPKPVTHIDGDRRWIWPEVKEWLKGSRAAQ